MRMPALNRKIHRWGALLTAIPVLVILVSGLFLQFKKESAWIQPPTCKGDGEGLTLTFDEALAIASRVPEAGIRDWDDVDRIDVRPGKGVMKLRANNRWEVQIDTHTGAVLQVAYRRSDLIESIHDGTFFHDRVKLWVFFPAALALLALWGTGLYLFFLPYLNRRNHRR